MPAAIEALLGHARFLSRMAQTKRKRRTKHRGNAAGSIEARGRTGRKPTEQELKKAAGRRRARASAATPSRPGAAPPLRAGFASIMLFALFQLGLAGNDPSIAELAAPRRRRVPDLRAAGLPRRPLLLAAADGQGGAGAAAASRKALSMDVRMFTVGPVQENCYIARRDGAREAVVIDPGDEADAAARGDRRAGVEVEAILLTHTHFDHVGAVAPVARATGARGLVPRARGAGPRRHHALRPVGRASARSSPTTPTTSSPAARRSSSPASTSTSCSRPATRPGHVTYSIAVRAGASSPATSSSRARSAAPTCRAATTRR